MKRIPDERDPLHVSNLVPEVLKTHGMVIPTVYNGIQYRSRLEARWAVFFDTLNLQFDYEPEGFDFGDVKYLPDFWFPDLGFYVEIKPDEPTEAEFRKAQLLQDATGKSVYVFYRSFVSVPEHSGNLWDTTWIPPACHDADHDYFWCECPQCGRLGIEYEGRSDRLPCKRCGVCSWYARNRHEHFDSFDVHLSECPKPEGGCLRSLHGDRGHTLDSPRLLMAYRAARSARFWK